MTSASINIPNNLESELRGFTRRAHVTLGLLCFGAFIIGAFFAWLGLAESSAQTLPLQMTKIDVPMGYEAEPSVANREGQVARGIRAVAAGFEYEYFWRILALSSFLLGSIIGFARYDAMPALVGIMFSIVFALGPQVIADLGNPPNDKAAEILTEVRSANQGYITAQRVLVDAQNRGVVASLRSDTEFVNQVRALSAAVEQGGLKNFDMINMLALEIAAFGKPTTEATARQMAELEQAARASSRLSDAMRPWALLAKVLLMALALGLAGLATRYWRIARLVERLSPSGSGSAFALSRRFA